MSDTTDVPGRLKYLNNGQLREEIAYAVGADPSRYGVDSEQGITIGDARRIGDSLQPEESTLDLSSTDLGGVYEAICDWAGGEYSPNAGKPWGINRDNLKIIHQAVGGRSPKEAVEA